MSVCDPEDGMHQLFKDAMPQNIVLPLPETEESASRLDDLLDDHGDTIAAVLIEPLVQGAAGMRMHDPSVLQTVRASLFI